MAKSLRDIVKAPAGVVKDAKLDGVKSSTKSKLTLGKNPGVDYDPKAPADRDFVAKHEVEKHADRVGNDKTPYTGDPEHYVLNSKKEKRHGMMKPADQSVYEGRGMKCEGCGSMYEGESCGCGKSAAEAKPGKKGMLVDKKKLQEVLTKKMSAGDVISDFVHSDNPKFDGKSKKERMKMALGAYYGMHPEKSKKDVKEELAMPMLEDGKTKKDKKVRKESAPADTPITYGDGVAQGRV